ncbi:MAG: helix-turn-helix domain-containing protein [Chloroflexi bacterium]|nr:helix-turn-helix domain-containing protein [Chloroflexota bacterium]
MASATAVRAERLVLTVREVAEELQCHRTVVYELIHSGELPSFKLGTKNHRIPREALERFIRDRAGMADADG